jgi:hypothetical protein
MLRKHSSKTKAPKGPLKMNTLDVWPLDTPDLQKVFVLAEQLTFAKYLLTIEPKNPSYVNFKNRCLHAVRMLSNAPDKTQNLHLDTYLKNKSILERVATGFDNDSSWIGLDTILDDPRFVGEYRQLSKEFYQPFLYSVCGTIPSTAELLSTPFGQAKVTFSPAILYPVIYREGSNLYMSYKAETFPTFVYSSDTKLFSDPNNPILTHLCRFNWSGKQFGDVVKTFADLKLDLNKFDDPTNITSAVYRGLLSTGSDQIKNCKGSISRLMSFVRAMSNVYGMPLTDVNRVGEFLSRFDGFDPEAVKYLMVKNPSVLMKQRFDQSLDLKFLGPIVETTIYGQEAAGKEDETSADDTQTTDDDTYSVEPDDTSSEEGNQDESSDDFGDAGDDDMVDPDGSSDDTTTDTSDGDSSEAIVADETDTQPEDPTTIAYNVLAADPSAEAIMYRHRVARALRGVVKNPPQELSTSTVTALKTWLTQWLYLVSPSTTKRFLTLILNNQSMVLKVR